MYNNIQNYFVMYLLNSPFAQIESGLKELLSQKVGFCTVGQQLTLTLAKAFGPEEKPKTFARWSK